MTRQMFLFGESAPPQDEVTTSEIRVLTWNLQSPALERARTQCKWLVDSKANVLVLTEASAASGSHHILSELESCGFKIFFDEPKTGEYATAVCIKGFPAHEWDISSQLDTPRVKALVLTTFLGEIGLFGLYGYSSWGDLSAEKIERRQAFQKSALNCLSSKYHHEQMIIAGDLNVVESDHMPQVRGFEDHRLYEGLLKLGLCDAYRYFCPTGHEHSWYSALRVGLRLDHCFVSKGLVQSMTRCYYDQSPRIEKLSDHAAMFLCLSQPVCKGSHEGDRHYNVEL